MSRQLDLGVLRRLLWLPLALLLIVSADLQPAIGQSGPSPSAQSPSSPAAQSGTPQPDQPSGTVKDSKPPTETKITPQQAEQLFRDVDTILDFASKDTTLEIKHSVTRREEVVAYLKKSMAEDKDVQRLRRTEFVLKKFGLLPKDFDLQTFLVGL